MMFPFIYKPEKSLEVHKKTLAYLEENEDVKEKIQDLSWVYHSLHNIIPVTLESFWSGHNFPYNESWDEIQISFTLVSFGLYKQALASLRSALELGLLSVYYNINDEGHKTVKKWLSSNDSKEADTPKIKDVWIILIANDNIKEFQNHIDLKKSLLDIGYLHNYVHTKGYKYSNALGLLKSNFQTFEEKGLKKWLNTLEQIVIIVTTLHLLKYPTALIRYDYSKKFGIDIPSFSHLQQGEIEIIDRLFPKDYMELLNKISAKDTETNNFLDWVESNPDMTKEDVEKQIIEMDRRHIERQGINDYKSQQLVLYRAESFDKLPKRVQKRIESLEKWAIQNNYIEPKLK